MNFILTDSLSDELLYSMENQDGFYLVDAKDGRVISQDFDEIDDKIDNDRYYEIPNWTSEDGFEVLREFTNNLHSPLAREELRNALNGGRGVFRRFKDAVKKYPEVEKLFFTYKEKAMREKISQWYDALRESWGMERLSVSDSDSIEETDELIQDDFIFREYDSAKDKNDIDSGCNSIAEEYEKQFSIEVGNALAFLQKKFSNVFDEQQKFGLICRTQSDDFTGCLLTSFCPSSSKTTVILTDFFVLQNYRGLGIGKELLNNTIAKLKENGVLCFLICNTIVPETMEPLLIRTGFRRIGSGYLADLSNF